MRTERWRSPASSSSFTILCWFSARISVLYGRLTFADQLINHILLYSMRARFCDESGPNGCVYAHLDSIQTIPGVRMNRRTIAPKLRLSAFRDVYCSPSRKSLTTAAVSFPMVQTSAKSRPMTIMKSRVSGRGAFCASNQSQVP